MPFPNSQSPPSQKLTDIFRNPPAGLENALQLAVPVTKTVLANLAVTYEVIKQGPGTVEYSHIADWPLDQQSLVRDNMLLALAAGQRIVFDWERAKTTSTTITQFGPGHPYVGITFRSPQVYPPYTIP